MFAMGHNRSRSKTEMTIELPAVSSPSTKFGEGTGGIGGGASGRERTEAACLFVRAGGASNDVSVYKMRVWGGWGGVTIEEASGSAGGIAEVFRGRELCFYFLSPQLFAVFYFSFS